MQTNETTVTMIKDLAELEQAYAIRRQVFIVEGQESEEVEFDGNDFCAAHLLAYWKGEAVGTMRLRIVSGSEGGTIIWERMAILKEARERNTWIFRALMKSARHYTDLMGLKNVIGIVENPKLMRFWQIYGGKETGEEPLEFRGHTYRPIRLTINRDEPREEMTLRQAIMAVPEVFAETRRNT
jgi:predicted GNAT family N-acyltransferase